MSSKTVTISIGRGARASAPHAPTGTHVVNATDWHEFQRGLLQAVGAIADEIHFTGEGIGWWTDNETGTQYAEDSFTVVFSYDSARVIYREWEDDATQRELLERKLRRLAVVYSQDSIALTHGTTEFVTH